VIYNSSAQLSEEYIETYPSTKPIKRFRSAASSSSSFTSTVKPRIFIFNKTTIAPHVMNTSKILSQLSCRLPREIKPRQYQLRLQPDLKNRTFDGNVKIHLEVLKPISFIPVHAKYLKVDTEEFWQLDETNTPLRKIIPVLTFSYPDCEYWVTEFSEPLQIGNYSLLLNFKGSMAYRIVGLYQSSYWDEARNKERWIATSKFEPTYARQAFPCFDEPSMKARFSITVIRPTGDNYHALSNMNVLEENPIDENFTATKFADSVPMSTYLVCFIVSDFANQSKLVRGMMDGAKDFEMRVFATASQVNKVEYALNVSVGITEYYIEYFNISYPLPKLDMAAIPDFVSGAMEHWGLVTYRETSLLYDKAISSSANKQRVAVVIAHELAHMWFGNLVGYYLVNYPEDMWRALNSALIETRDAFSAADRAHLISDVFALADASQLNYSIALDLSKYLENEVEYVPWSVGVSRLANIRNLVYYTELYSNFVNYARQLLNNVYEKVSWDVGDDHLENLLRVSVLKALCAFGHSQALGEAHKRFVQWLENPQERPHPDIRSAVYYYGMKIGGTEEIWQQVWKLFVNEQDAQEKVKLMEALAAINEPWILQRYINLAWNESYVRSQDYFSCLQFIAQNRVGHGLIWDYVRENWPRLVERFGINERYMGRMIPAITSRFATQTKLDEMESFFAKYPEAGAGTAARKEALENVKNNIKWLEQNKDHVGKWLESQQTLQMNKKVIQQNI
uniref:Aminopeptidase n=1 Tax=Glossina brevipalpis TaxID=37001 RepID=A0A1A9WMJ1_9MUSC